MNFKEIQGLTVNELKKRSRELRAELFTLKMKNTLGQVNNPLEVRTVRRSIARLLTALTQKSGN
jgi:large subunit ribosomal protein L29